MLAPLLTASGVRAQLLLPPQQGVLKGDRHVSVRERPHPELTPQGVRLGTFKLSPSLGVAGLYDDNVRATEVDAIDDFSTRITPQLQLQSDWEPNSLSLRLGSVIERFAKLESENRNDLEAAADGTFSITRETSLRFAGRWQRQRESRQSQDIFVQTRRPIQYRTTGAGVGLSHLAGDLFLTGDATIVRYDFDDAHLMDGAPIDQDFRDSVLIRLRGRAEYAQSPSVAFFGQVTHDQREYRARVSGAPGRDSNGVELLAGVRFEPNLLARGEIGIGYLTRNYRSPTFTDFSGFAINSKVELFPSELTTVTVTGSREANDSGIPGTSGYITTLGSIQVDHELLRSLILSASTQYQTDRFNGVDRRDKRWGARAVADYRMNKNISLRLSYDHLQLLSDGVDRYKAFNDNRFLLGVTLRQ